MPVMQIRVVRMAVRKPFVCVPVRMRLRARPRQFVAMAVMLVVHMRVLMCLRRMDVLVLVSLG